jgi:hypothetical protein
VHSQPRRTPTTSRMKADQYPQPAHPKTRYYIHTVYTGQSNTVFYPSPSSLVRSDTHRACMAYLTGRSVCIQTPLPVRNSRYIHNICRMLQGHSLPQVVLRHTRYISDGVSYTGILIRRCTTNSLTGYVVVAHISFDLGPLYPPCKTRHTHIVCILQGGMCT